MTAAARQPATFHVITPHGEVGLWWLDLPAASREAQRQLVRQQTAQILDRQFPAASLARIHWPPGAEHPPNLAYAAQAWPHATHSPTQTPALWLSWSYLPAPHPASLLQQALLAIGPLPLGVDVAAGHLLPQPAWADVLRLYGGVASAPALAQECASLWTAIEAADKCLRTGLREWSPPVATDRSRCTLVALPLAHPGLAATLAWLAPVAG